MIWLRNYTIHQKSCKLICDWLIGWWVDLFILFYLFQNQSAAEFEGLLLRYHTYTIARKRTFLSVSEKGNGGDASEVSSGSEPEDSVEKGPAVLFYRIV